MLETKKPTWVAGIDIIGWTPDYITSSRAKRHAQVIIREIIKSIDHTISSAFTIDRREGDALFCYKIEDIQDNREELVHVLKNVFENAMNTLNRLKDECSCVACKNMDKVHVRIVIDRGDTALYESGEFKEIVGVPVWMVKSILQDWSLRGIILTESAASTLGLVQDLKDMIERETDSGKIKIGFLEFQPTLNTYLPKMKKSLKALRFMLTKPQYRNLRLNLP